MGSATLVLLKLLLSSATEMPKRQRRGSGSGGGGGSSSSGSSNSSRKRRQAKTTMPPPPSTAPASASSRTAESNPFESDSTNTASTIPAPSSPSSTASPKLSKLGKVKAALRRKLPSGKNKKKKTSISSSSSGGISDTSVEGDSSINTKKGRISVVPEVTVTPSTDSSTSASPAASVRTIFRIDPRTGKPAQPQPRRTRNSSRASSLQFPRRTSSLRHSDEFPFDPNTAARQPDDSHLYQSNPPSPTACKQLSARAPSLEAPSINSNNSLDKPLPALPLEQRSSVIDFHAAGTATPAQVSPKSIKTDDDDTPRAPAWPLPVERQSVYGPASHIFDAPPVPPKDNSLTTVDARSGSGSSQLSLYGFHYYNPLDHRVLAARLQQIRANLPNNVTPDGFPSVPTSTAAPRTPPTFTNQFEDAFQTFTSQTPAQSELSTRASFASALSTTASFMTALEDVGGDADDEASAAEGEAAAENKRLSIALLSPSENNDAAPAETNINSAPESLDDSGIDMSKDDATYDATHANCQLRTDESSNIAATAIAHGEVNITGNYVCHDEDDAASSASSEFEMRIPTDEDCTILPFRITTSGPPTLTTDLQEDVLAFEYNPVRNSCAPKWKIEPDIDTITAMIGPYARLCGLPNEDIKVEFLAKGAWNMVYTVTAVDTITGTTAECVFRCALPGYPWFRMQLEISTMEYVRMNTTIPVPKVYAFNSSMENPLGLEWLLMEKINGTPYYQAQISMTFDAKAQLHRDVADWVHQLSQLSFDKMGCVYRRWDIPLTNKNDFVIGPMNDWEFTEDFRIDLDFHRGPFTSKEQYFNSLISMRIAEATDPRLKERAEYYEARRSAAKKIMEEAFASGEISTVMPPEDPDIERVANDTYTLEAIRKVPKYAVGLQSLLPFVCGSEWLGPGSTYLYHNDIHANNIMVDASGKPIALLDWEGVYACPHDWTERYPKLIDPEERRQPEPFDIVGPMDEYRADQEAAWELFQLRNAYDERLKELDSPVLREREINEDLDAIMERIQRIEFYYRDWDFIDEVKEKEMMAMLGV